MSKFRISAFLAAVTGMVFVAGMARLNPAGPEPAPTEPAAPRAGGGGG